MDYFIINLMFKDELFKLNFKYKIDIQFKIQRQYLMLIYPGKNCQCLAAFPTDLPKKLTFSTTCIHFEEETKLNKK